MRVVIQDVVYRGWGLARTSDGVVLVRHTLPGERVEVEPTRRTRRLIEGRLVAVLEAAPGRREPVCPLTRMCPGCCYQHAAYADELALKQRQLAEVLHRLGRVTPENLEPPLGAPAELGYRNKLTLRGGRCGGRALLGYVGEDNRQIVDVPRCPLAVPALDQALSEVRGDAALRRQLSRGGRLTLRYTAADGVCRWIGRPGPAQPWLTESLSWGRLRVPRGSFFQVNLAVAERLAEDLQRRLRQGPAVERLIDLYCGVGLLALAAAAAGVPDVLGIEADAEAVRAAAENAAQLGLRQARFVAGEVAERLKALTPLARAEATAVVVDPPRAGLSPAALEGLAALRAARIFYVSCAPDTLARDLGRLAARGYRLRQARLLDMFPRTAHFETLAVLEPA